DRQHKRAGEDGEDEDEIPRGRAAPCWCHVRRVHAAEHDCLPSRSRPALPVVDEPETSATAGWSNPSLTFPDRYGVAGPHHVVEGELPSSALARSATRFIAVRTAAGERAEAEVPLLGRLSGDERDAGVARQLGGRTGWGRRRPRGGRPR